MCSGKASFKDGVNFGASYLKLLHGVICVGATLSAVCVRAILEAVCVAATLKVDFLELLLGGLKIVELP